MQKSEKISSARLYQPTYLETLVIARLVVGGTLECIYEGAVVRRMGEPEIAAFVRQLRKCQLGDGLRNNRPDRAELHTGSHERSC